MLKQISGDIIELNVDLIIQQCNCLTTRSHSLSKAISNNLGVDIYSFRRNTPGRSNLAIQEDRGIPGNVEIISATRGNTKYVACLFGQFSPGKPGKFYQGVISEAGLRDDADQRLNWFTLSLRNLRTQIDILGIKTLAIPKYIGCGLAGGDPNLYKIILDDFIKTLNPDIITYIVSYD